MPQIWHISRFKKWSPCVDCWAASVNITLRRQNRRESFHIIFYSFMEFIQKMTLDFLFPTRATAWFDVCDSLPERVSLPEGAIEKSSCILPTLQPCTLVLATPFRATAPYAPASPKCTLLLRAAAVVKSPTGLLFDFTPEPRRSRQARPGISAMRLKNGNRRHAYKRRRTVCGSVSLGEEWVVD